MPHRDVVTTARGRPSTRRTLSCQLFCSAPSAPSPTPRSSSAQPSTTPSPSTASTGPGTATTTPPCSPATAAPTASRRTPRSRGEDVDAAAVHATKSRLFQERLAAGGAHPAPGVRRDDRARAKEQRHEGRRSSPPPRRTTSPRLLDALAPTVRRRGLRRSSSTPTEVDRPQARPGRLRPTRCAALARGTPAAASRSRTTPAGVAVGRRSRGRAASPSRTPTPPGTTSPSAAAHRRRRLDPAVGSRGLSRHRPRTTSRTERGMTLTARRPHAPAPPAPDDRHPS